MNELYVNNFSDSASIPPLQIKLYYGKYIRTFDIERSELFSIALFIEEIEKTFEIEKKYSITGLRSRTSSPRRIIARKWFRELQSLENDHQESGWDILLSKRHGYNESNDNSDAQIVAIHKYHQTTFAFTQVLKLGMERSEIVIFLETPHTTINEEDSLAVKDYSTSKYQYLSFQVF